LETDGLPRLVVRALCHCAVNAISAVSGGWGGALKTTAPLRFTVAEVMIAAQELAIGDGLGDAETLLTNRKVGRALSRLRLRKAPRAGGRGSRLWQISLGELQGVVSAYGVSFPHISDGNRVGEPKDASTQDGDDTYAQIAQWVKVRHGDGAFQ
jgi:hypothetical protein